MSRRERDLASPACEPDCDAASHLLDRDGQLRPSDDGVMFLPPDLPCREIHAVVDAVLRSLGLPAEWTVQVTGLELGCWPDRILRASYRLVRRDSCG